MAKTAKNTINDVYLNEFFFDWVWNMTIEERKKMTPAQLRVLKTAKRAKHFSVTSSLDEKLLMLAKTGVRYGLMLYGEGKLLERADFKKMYDKQKNEVTEVVGKKIKAGKTFVTTDRQVMMMANLAAHQCHSATFLLNRDFHKVGMNIWRYQEVLSTSNEELKETADCAKMINKLALNIILNFKFIKGRTLLAEVDFCILMYLFHRQNQYVERAVINNFFTSYYRLFVVSESLNGLCKNAYIEKCPSSRRVEFQISSRGIEIVMEWMGRMINETLNF